VNTSVASIAEGDVDVVRVYDVCAGLDRELVASPNAMLAFQCICSRCSNNFLDSEEFEVGNYFGRSIDFCKADFP
jgi:hypothetical protein